MNLRCWLFGHEWLHLDTSFAPNSADVLRSAHLCDRCDEERGVVISVDYYSDDPDDGPVDPRPIGEEPIAEDADT